MNANPGLPWDSSFKFKRNDKIAHWPLKDLFKFDQENGTRFAFYADIEFDDETIRKIHAKDKDLCAKINDYFWDRMCINIKSNNVLLFYLKEAKCVLVCCVFVVYLVHALLVWKLCTGINYTDQKDKPNKFRNNK